MQYLGTSVDKQSSEMTKYSTWLRLSDYCVIPSGCLSTEEP